MHMWRVCAHVQEYILVWLLPYEFKKKQQSFI